MGSNALRAVEADAVPSKSKDRVDDLRVSQSPSPTSRHRDSSSTVVARLTDLADHFCPRAISALTLMNTCGGVSS